MSCLVALCIIESLREIETHRPARLANSNKLWQWWKSKWCITIFCYSTSRNSRTTDNYKKTTRLYVKCMMELVQYVASHIGETIISFYNRQSDTGDDFFSRPADQNHVCRFCTKRYLYQYFAASAYYFSGLPRSVAQTLHDITLHHPIDGSPNDAALPIAALQANKSTAALIDTNPSDPSIFSTGEVPLERLEHNIFTGRLTTLLPRRWHSTPVGATNHPIRCLQRIQQWYWPMPWPW